MIAINLMNLDDFSIHRIIINYQINDFNVLLKCDDFKQFLNSLEYGSGLHWCLGKETSLDGGIEISDLKLINFCFFCGMNKDFNRAVEKWVEFFEVRDKIFKVLTPFMV